MLRQDLFAVRDELWDRMRAEELLDHPAHRWCRNNLNSLIRFAPVLSWWSILTLWLGSTNVTPDATAEEFDQGELPNPVSEADAKAAYCVLRYLFRWTLTGWVLLAVFSVSGKLKECQSWIASAVTRASRSEEIRTVGRHPAKV